MRMIVELNHHLGLATGIKLKVETFILGHRIELGDNVRSCRGGFCFFVNLGRCGLLEASGLLSGC